MILNYINANLPKLKLKCPDFEVLCLPGLTEEFRLNLFIHLEPNTNIRVVFASEESTSELKEEFTNMSSALCMELKTAEITDILGICEKKMSERQSKNVL
jgi:hypothetical protein